MLDQFTFDKAEEIADALHEQDGLDRALIGYLAAKLPPEHEHVVHALLHGQAHCRQRAAAAAVAIVRGAPVDDTTNGKETACAI